MDIYLMRHGETDWNLQKRIQGSSDIPLNAEGLRLAQAVGRALAPLHFDRCYCSPLLRARQTAELVLAGRELPIHYDARLEEFHFGALEGKRFPWRKRFPLSNLYRLFNHAERYRPRGGGESLSAMAQRCSSFLEEVLKPLEGQVETVLVSSHGGWLRQALHLALGEEGNFWQRSYQPNCAVNLLRLEQGRFQLVYEARSLAD